MLKCHSFPAHYPGCNITFYSQAEDSQMSMDNERRKIALKNYLLHIHQLVEKEKKGKEGMYCRLRILLLCLFYLEV